MGDYMDFIIWVEEIKKNKTKIECITGYDGNGIFAFRSSLWVDVNLYLFIMIYNVWINNEYLLVTDDYDEAWACYEQNTSGWST